jgi:hypothetical protein
MPCSKLDFERRQGGKKQKSKKTIFDPVEMILGHITGLAFLLLLFF